MRVRGIVRARMTQIREKRNEAAKVLALKQLDEDAQIAEEISAQEESYASESSGEEDSREIDWKSSRSLIVGNKGKKGSKGKKLENSNEEGLMR